LSEFAFTFPAAPEDALAVADTGVVAPAGGALSKQLGVRTSLRVDLPFHIAPSST